MRYPENLKIGDTIGICAPSNGVTDEFKIKRLDAAIESLKQMGYLVMETESVRKSKKKRSASGKQRAKEFMELMENPKVKLILFANGGDFLVEMLDYLDWDTLKQMEPKWIQGYSDITGIEWMFNTILEVPSIYCDTVKSYAMKPLQEGLKSALKIASGEEIKQESFQKHEGDWEEEEDPTAPPKLTEPVEWKNITGATRVEIQGRSIGGCFDCVTDFIGTKYDCVKQYIEKYEKEGIIWFLECFEMGTAEVYRRLWQMKNAGYFEGCKGIIFGRPLFKREDFGISYEEAVLDAIGDLQIPIIMDADIGHVSPQMAIVNGGMLRIISENGKGTVENF